MHTLPTMTGRYGLKQALSKAKEECRATTLNASAPTGENGEPLRVYCPAEWDNVFCWPHSPPGPVTIGCPRYVEYFDHDGLVRRHCMESGLWHFSLEKNKTWRNSSCLDAMPSELLETTQQMTSNFKRLVLLYTVGYACTFLALIFATFILAYFRTLHCTRNYIHLHLFASFMLRATFVFITNRILLFDSGILDYSSSKSNLTMDELLFKFQDQQNQSYRVGCKFMMTLFYYFTAANYYWVLVEALHLNCLLILTVFSGKKYYRTFILIGWGAPVLFVVPWAIVRATLADTDCWDDSTQNYQWIHYGPIVIANVINFILFLNIVRVLWNKMRENTVPDNRNQYRHRKLAKSTLALIFMFGIHAIVFIGVPDSVEIGDLLWNIRMYFDLFFNSFQGFFAAIIYCFCNSEVQQELKRAWKRFQDEVDVNRNTGRESIRPSTTALSSLIRRGRHQQAGASADNHDGRRGSSSPQSPDVTINNDCNSSRPSTSSLVSLLQQNEKQNSATADREADQLLANAPKSDIVLETSLPQIAPPQGQDYEEMAS